MSSIDSVYWIFFVTGLTVGFGHCVGMCGPIVVSFSLKLKGRPALLPHYLYHMGRITTYAFLGGVTGLTGSFTTITSHVVGIQKWVMIMAGILIIIMAVGTSGWVRFSRIFPNRQKQGDFISKTFKKISSVKTKAAYFPMGILLGFLPCGPVYTALLASARNGMDAPNSLTGFLSGTALMVTYGVGTVPALLFVGKLSGMGWIKKREIIYRLGSLFMIALGLFFIIKGINY
jgi:hypothetical protein